jgi:phosphoglycerol transferase MdoB-like AlkP superfamily enzyme
MFFNPKYKLLGMLSYPYWFFFEQLAPLIELTGILVFFLFAILGIVQWSIFFILLGCVFLFGFLFSIFAILMEVQTYNQYKSEKDNFRLIATAFLEPFIFHPFIVWSALLGHIDYLRKNHNWGEMTRQGLNLGQQRVNAGENLIVETKSESRFLQGIGEAIAYSLTLFVGMLIVKAIEIIRDAQHFGIPKDIFSVINHGIINDISFDFNIAILLVSVFMLLYLLNQKLARIFFISFSVLLIMIHAALAEYFLRTLVPLGADLFGYTMADIRQTVGAAGVSTTFIFIAVILIALVIYLFLLIPKRIKLKPALSLPMLGLLILGAYGSIATVTNRWKPGPEFSNSMALNKSFFFFNNCYQSFFTSKSKEVPYPDNTSNPNHFNYVNEKAYPFLRTVDSTDVLSPFFNPQATRPNFVFLVVEGLGRAFSNKDAYLGSFTPFLDSLSNQSLYWSNFLSEGGRTFAMLPAIYGSLPFGKNGFLELGDQMPAHNSLFNILKENGYTCNFFYGGDAVFDNMSKFVKMDGGHVYDEKTFSGNYVKMPKSESGFTWGYGDDQVLAKLNEVNKNAEGPTLNAVMTLSTHSPFLVNEQDEYLNLFEQRMEQLNFTEAQKEEHRRYKNQYATILYTDNSIRDFINNYKNRPDFKNTIFIITGDHRMPEIPMSTKIDRYHVPLIIYSPMLKRSQTFKAVSTHFDITPSLLTFLKNQYHFKVPQEATWMGSGLDTAHYFRNTHAYPLMQTKNDITDFIMDDYMLHNDDLYKISDKMYLDPIDNEIEKSKLKTAFAMFKERNAIVVKGASLMPDSLLVK